MVGGWRLVLQTINFDPRGDGKISLSPKVPRSICRCFPKAAHLSRGCCKCRSIAKERSLLKDSCKIGCKFDDVNGAFFAPTVMHENILKNHKK